MSVRRDRHVNLVVFVADEAAESGCGFAAQHRVRTAVQQRGPKLLVATRWPRVRQQDSRIAALPTPSPQPPAHCVGTESVNCLLHREYPHLSGQQVGQRGHGRHPESVQAGDILHRSSGQVLDRRDPALRWGQLPPGPRRAGPLADRRLPLAPDRTAARPPTEPPTRRPPPAEPPLAPDRTAARPRPSPDAVPFPAVIATSNGTTSRGRSS